MTEPGNKKPNFQTSRPMILGPGLVCAIALLVIMITNGYGVGESILIASIFIVAPALIVMTGR